jgi:DNA polymerase (family X)
MQHNKLVADVFHAIADALEIQGEERYRFLSYRRVGDAIAALDEPLGAVAARGELEALPGVGKVLAAKIDELLRTGQLAFYEQLKQQLPPGVLELLRVPEVGPRTAGRLWRELGIDSIEALRSAASEGRLRTLKGFGPKTEQKLLAAINGLSAEQRLLLSEALAVADILLGALRAAYPALAAASYAGSLRRGQSTVGDIDLLVAADDGAAVVAAFTRLPMVAEVVAAGPIKATVALQNGLHADLLVAAPRHWGSALQHFTGSQAHNIQLRERAQAQGLSFGEYGFRRDDDTLIECQTEDEVYATLGLPFIPPELREGQGEFEAAANGSLPHLVTLHDLRADLHMHSTWSDGHQSIAEMAEAARARGYSQIAITDHSAYLGITGGVTVEGVRAQAAEVAALNARFADEGSAFRILHGVEVDITPDGSLALPDEVLATLDIVVASLHVSLRQERQVATERLLRAIRNRHVDIIGHPTGRILNRRPGADLEFDAILTAAAETHTALEINAGPDRLDLDAEPARRALQRGVLLAIDSDAHHARDLGNIHLGVTTARRAWATPERVLNCWHPEHLRAWLARSP